MLDDEWEPREDASAEVVDPVFVDARQTLMARFEVEPTRVFYSKQLEVMYERQYYHWITNRAVRLLQREGVLTADTRPTPTGEVVLVSHRGHRYPVRDRDAVGRLVAEFSSHRVGEALGHNGESLVLGGFARSGFTLVDEEARSYAGREWTFTDHNFDQIWEKDHIAYGVEVKNTWSYLDKAEFDLKIRLAHYIGVVPVFAVRMIPADWILELRDAGGFALIFRWQMYPLYLRDLAARIRGELGLPADSPRRLHEGTMGRMVGFHERLVRAGGL